MIDFPKQVLPRSLNLVPAHTWLADSSGALTFVNERFADYLGLAKGHPLRIGIDAGGALESLVGFLHPSDQDTTRKAWSMSIDSGSSVELMFRVRNADGQYRWFLGRAEPCRGDDREPRCWIGINFDVEERKEAVAEGQRLAHIGNWVFNSDGFEYWSPELFRIHGLDPDSMTPAISDYLALVHPEDREFVTHEIQQMLTNRGKFDFTKRIVRPDGVVRHVRCVGTTAADGRVGRRSIGTGMDVTDQEQLIVALRKGEEELRKILDLVPQLVGVMGPKGERLYANRVALAYVGVSLEEWLRAPRGSHIHPEDREHLRGFEQGAPASVPIEAEIRMRGSDGIYRWFLVRYNPVCDNQGQVIRWYAACTDINERKKAEERLRQENVALREDIEKNSMFEEIVGSSPALTAVLSRVCKVAASDSTVLISGETGTGKELVARAIHRRSPRSAKAFVAVNCAAIPRELVASELFGHEKGAFTGATHRRLGRFELADGGTIFLDEVGDLLPDTQIALLRVLQEREFERVGGTETVRANVRVIAATNRDLASAVAEGNFRQDLFYRLNVFPVEMPPLRERRQDIPRLVKYFIARYAQKADKVFQRINVQTLDRLQSYPWPGNVRELQNVIERSVVVCDSEEFTIDDSWLSSRSSVEGQCALSSTLSSHEKTLIEEALHACGGRVFGPEGAATRLGVPRSTLESKIRALKIDKSRFRTI